MALASGTKLGAYEIQSLLGVGAMGEVYRARDTRLDRVVAIKNPYCTTLLLSPKRRIVGTTQPCHQLDFGPEEQVMESSQSSRVEPPS